MTVLEELLEQIELDEAESDGAPSEWGDGVFEMPFSVAKALLRMAEAAFELEQATALHADYCANCSGSNYGTRPEHAENCPWHRIQDLKMELESSQVVE